MAKEGVSGATLSELDKAVSDLHRAEKLQQTMKDANAIIRSKLNVTERLIKEAGLTESQAYQIQQPDYANRVGFPTYKLTNNNASIKRLQGRVKMLEKKVTGGTTVAKTGNEERYTFEGGEIFVNYPEDRIQVLFPGGRVEKELYKKFRSNGFVYSPTNKAFQRKITPQGIRVAVRMFNAVKVEGEKESVNQTPPIPSLETNGIIIKIPEYSVGVVLYNSGGQDRSEGRKLYNTDLAYRYLLKNNEGAAKAFLDLFNDGDYIPYTEKEYQNLKLNIIVTFSQNTIEDKVEQKSNAEPEFIAPDPVVNKVASSKALDEIVEHFKNPNVHIVTPSGYAAAIPKQAIGRQDRDKKYVKLKRAYEGMASDTIGEVLEVPNMFVKKVKFGDKTIIIDNNHIEKSEAPEIVKVKAIEVLEPNTPNEFDEIIMEQLEPNADRVGNHTKEQIVKLQIYERVKGDEEDRRKEVDRIFEIYKKRAQSIQPVTIEEPVTAYHGTAFNYKNQYELNKAIEALLTHKASTTLYNDSSEYTSDEKNFIRKYSGYGGLDKYGATGKGGLFEYYTPTEVIEKMYALAYKYGYNNGAICEPSVATGEFLQFAKPETRIVGYEISEWSARICKILYPNAEIFLQPFEQLFINKNWTIKNNTDDLEKFDLVIGNPPYGDFSTVASRYMTGMGEKDFTKARNYVEYFIRRGLDLLNPGGLLIYIVGAQVKNGGTLFLDSGTTPVKEYLAQHATLLDAYRLPDSIFERTGVTSEIIVIKKN